MKDGLNIIEYGLWWHTVKQIMKLIFPVNKLYQRAYKAWSPCYDIICSDNPLSDRSDTNISSFLVTKFNGIIILVGI